jgi:hypothetical protein
MASSSKILALLINLLLLSFSSCGNLDSVPSDTVVTASPTILPMSVPTGTLHSTVASLACTSYTEPNLAYDYYDLSSFLNDIVTNLNNCVSAATILDDLRFINKYGFAFTIDLNQDHIEEIFAGGALFLLPSAGQTWTEGHKNLIVFYQQNAKYESKIIFEGTFNGYPELSNIIDINVDGVNEVVFTIPYGGSGCNEIVSVIGWQDNEPIDYFRDVNLFVDCPADTQVVDTDGDGIMEVVQKHRGPLINSYGPEKILYRLNTELNSYSVVP